MDNSAKMWMDIMLIYAKIVNNIVIGKGNLGMTMLKVMEYQ
jgi:hypothetical protein